MKRGDKGRDTRRDAKDQTPPPRHEGKNRTGLQSFWIDGKGINREVLQRYICRMCGNEARCKPDKYNGVSGYKILAVRPPTEEQLEDLVEISKEFERESEDNKRQNRKQHADLSYDDSITMRRHDSSYDDPKYGEPKYGDPKYGDPKYGDPKYGDPKYADPKYGDPSKLYRDDRYPPNPYQAQGQPETYPPAQYQNPYGQPSVPGYPTHGRRSPGPPPGPNAPSGYPVSGYPSTRPPPRGYPEPGRPQEAAHMYPPYGDDDMDLDEPSQTSYRPGLEYPPQPRQAGNYPGHDRPPRENPYMTHGPYGGPPPAQYGADPSMPRHMPPGEPPGRGGMPMQTDYDDYPRGPPLAGGYKVPPIREEKRPRHDDYRRR